MSRINSKELPFYSEARRESRKRGGEFSILNILHGLSNTRTVSGSAEADYLKDLERALPGYEFNPNNPRIPIELLADSSALPEEIALGRRDMTVAGVSGSNYLVSTPNAPIIETLAPFSIAVQAGITVTPGLRDNQLVPRETSLPTSYWLGGENVSITESQPSLGVASAMPYMAGVLLEFTEQFRRQANAETYLQSALLRSIGRLIDQAVLAGTGADGQPLGLVHQTGVQTHSGTSLGLSGLVAMIKNARVVGGQSVGFIADPVAEGLLRAREAASGNGFCWTGDTLAGVPAHATSLAPASTVIAGPWPSVNLLTWGDFSVQVTHTDFARGVLGMRILLGVDVVLGNAAAFTVASSVT